MLDPFDQKKAQILKEISANSEDSPDASPKGTIDELCIPMMHLLNSHNDIVTTSSCSGRVSVFVEGSKEHATNTKIGAKGEGGQWLFVSHDPAEIDNWWVGKDLKFNSDEPHEIDASTRYVLYKFEPFILHVKCRNLEWANKLYTTAMSCGFRESGIGSNNIVAVRISIKLDIPIAYMNSNNELVSIVSENYLQMMVKLSLDRFTENTRRINMLHESFAKLFAMPIALAPVPKETKEERKLRKMKEGMDRRDDVRKLKQLLKLAKLAQLQLESTV